MLLSWCFAVVSVRFRLSRFSDVEGDLDLDGQGGKMFLRVLLNLVMHNYPSLVSGALQLLFRHFSQRQEVLNAFKQVSDCRTRFVSPLAVVVDVSTLTSLCYLLFLYSNCLLFWRSVLAPGLWVQLFCTLYFAGLPGGLAILIVTVVGSASHISKWCWELQAN